MLRTVAFLPVATSVGCFMPKLDGDWDVRITDLESLYAVEGALELDRSRDDLEGTFALALFDQCDDAEAMVVGRISEDKERVELDIEFDAYECDGDDYTIYDMAVDLLTFEQAGELEVLYGDGTWGEGRVDFLAQR